MRLARLIIWSMLLMPAVPLSAAPVDEPIATFSIVARDPATGELGVAVASRFFAVGSVVPWARAGVGAVATQAYGNSSFGPRGLELLERGGRAAIGNPWIFSQVHTLLENRAITPIDLTLRAETMKKYLYASAAYFGELTACRMMRSRLGWFVKGLPQSTRFRHAITKIRTCHEANQVIDNYYGVLSNNLL